MNEALQQISQTINDEYGFEGDIPRINYGPCGVFAYVFFHEWQERFSEPVNICFVMTKDGEECDHVCIRLPDGRFFDGGIGIHSADVYAAFDLHIMDTYDHDLLEKWSFGLDRTYPRYCPAFDRTFVQNIIRNELDKLRQTF